MWPALANRLLSGPTRRRRRGCCLKLILSELNHVKTGGDQLKSFKLDGASVGVFFFFFGKQFHYPLHGEKARFGLKAAARPVSNSGEE